MKKEIKPLLIALLVMLLVTALIMLVGCSEEIGPCYSNEQRCKELQQLMNQSTGAEKEKYYQKYLTEKHILENCLATHD